jgi:hypothetical protein
VDRHLMQRCDAYVIYIDIIIVVTLYDSDRKENCQIRSAPHSISLHVLYGPVSTSVAHKRSSSCLKNTPNRMEEKRIPPCYPSLLVRYCM